MEPMGRQSDVERERQTETETETGTKRQYSSKSKAMHSVETLIRICLFLACREGF